MFLIQLFYLSSTLLAQTYICDKDSFVDIKVHIAKESIECAVQEKEKIIFKKLRLKIQKSFTKDQAYPHEIMLRQKNSQQVVPVFLTKQAIAYQAKLFDNGHDYFRDGMARIEYLEKVGFINKEGNLTIPPQYTFAFPFRNGYAKVCNECNFIKQGEYTAIESDQWFYIDKENRKWLSLLKTRKLPFDQNLQNKYFPKLKNNNSTEAREKLSKLCSKDKKFCLNYATFLFEDHFSNSLKEYHLDINEMIHSTSRSSKEEPLTKKQFLALLKKLEIKDPKISTLSSLTEYMYKGNKESIRELENLCKKNDEIACYFAGNLWDHQLDRKKAKQYFEKSCRLGRNEGCESKLRYK